MKTDKKRLKRKLLGSSISVISKLLLTSTLFTSCSDQVLPVSNNTNDSKDEMAGGTVAVVNMNNDQFIEFVEPVPGELVIFGSYDASTVASSDVAQSPVALYEFYSGKKAPQSLVNAYERSVRNNASHGDDNPEMVMNEVALPDTRRGLAKKLPYNEFLQKYCNVDDEVQNNYSHMSYRNWWTAGTGTYSKAFYCRSMGLAINPYKGNSLKFKLEYFFDGTWGEKFNRTIYQGNEYTCYTSSNWLWRRFTISDADGDSYNVAYYGDAVLSKARWGASKLENHYVPINVSKRSLGCWTIALATVMHQNKIVPVKDISYKTSMGNGVYAWCKSYPVNISDVTSYIDDSKAAYDKRDSTTAKYLFYMSAVVGKNFDWDGTPEHPGYLTTWDELPGRISNYCNCDAKGYHINETGAGGRPNGEDIIKYEINHGRPLFLYLDNNLSGNDYTGHAMVIDAYRGSGTNFVVHLNVGGGDMQWVYFHGPIRHWTSVDWRYLITVKP